MHLAPSARRAVIAAGSALALAAALIPATPSSPVAAAPPDDFTLTILHHNDGESQLIDAGDPDFGGIARFKTLADDLKAAADTDDDNDWVMVTAGDNYLAGPEFSASSTTGFSPFYDALALNAVGYDAVVIGNHEFDFGPDVLESFVAQVDAPVLSANLDYTNEPGLLALETAGELAKSTIVEKDGRQIAIIGATTENLPFISSPREVIINDVATAVQAEIDALPSDVGIVILSAHLQGLAEDSALVPLLSGVDVAIAGGGDELLCQTPEPPLVPGDVCEGDYGFTVNNADGTAVPIVTSAGDYKYIGRLQVTFNDAGDLLTVDPGSGPVRVSGVGADAVGEDPALLADVTAPVSAFVAQLASNVIGTSEVPLNGVRNPGIRTQETNEGNLVADAFRWQANQLLDDFGITLPGDGEVDIAIGNGGGIRNNNVIPAGDITELTTFDILPFTNFISVFEAIPRDQLKLILENAYSNVENVDGRFAQVSGMSVVFDPYETPAEIDDDGNVVNAGSRVQHVQLDDGTVLVENGVVQAGDPVSIATVDFLARGGDQYPFGDAPFSVLGTTYQQALFNYITADSADGGLGGTISAADYPVDGEGRIAQEIRINEFVFNHRGADRDEFIEVAGIPDRSYDQYSLLVVEGDGAGQGIVDAVFPLSAMDANGFETFGFFRGFLENGSQTLLLVKHFTGGAGTDLDTDNDGTIDADAPLAVLVDDVAVLDGRGRNALYSSVVLDPNFDGLDQRVGGASRIPNLIDTDATTDWVRNDFQGAGLPSFPGVLADTDEAINTPGADNRVQVPLTPIPEIQSAAHLSPFVGQTVTTTGIVTGVAFNGFYLQDPDGDGDDATSDGIFVSTGSGPNVAVNDAVQVSGEVQESIGGGASTGNLSVTRIVASDIFAVGAGDPISPVVIGSSGRVPPKEIVISDDELPTNLQTDPAMFDPDEDAIDFYEALEGMLVTVEQPQLTSATRTFNSFSSEFFTVPNDGANVAPADALNARGGIDLQPDPDNTGDQNPERVQIQLDGTLYPFDVPDLSVGTRIDDVTGVVGYSFGNFEVNALTEIVVREASSNVPAVSELTASEDDLLVAVYNVLNLNGTDAANAQRDLIASQIVNNLNSPDIVALQEIQDNNGSVDDGTTDASITLQRLVDAIVVAGGPQYTFFTIDPVDNTQGGIPGGNIRNAFLYNEERVSLDSAENIGSVDDVFASTRLPLVGEFVFQGEPITVINNHLTSRFGSTPIFGGPQPFVQAGEAAREAQTQFLNDYVDELLKADPDAQIVVAGDLNTFQWTNDIAEILPGPEPVLTNLIDGLSDDEVYTFIFDGNSQVLDHALVTDSLVDRATLDIVHVNVDFPRTPSTVTGSDHEPLLLQLDLSTPDTTPPEVTAELDLVFFIGDFVGEVITRYECTDDVEVARCTARLNGVAVDPDESVIIFRSPFRFDFEVNGQQYIAAPRFTLRALGIDTSGNRTVARDVLR